jgi:RHS repeat-associated protein
LTVKRNSNPLVVFTSPSATSFNSPANITLGVDAVSPAGSIGSVTLTRNGSPLATLTAPPYQYTLSGLASGSYTIGATATDNAGQTGTASLVLAVGGPNLLPSVSLTSPTPSFTFSTPANITMTAAANDSDGYVAQVEFLRNGNLLGATNVAPYTFVWSNAPEGSHELTARATDNAGGVATSPTVAVTVRTPPPVAITSPPNGATFTTPAAVTLTAEAPNNTLGVSFYRRVNGVDTLIGDSPSTGSPYTYNWSVRTAGTYTVVSRALVQVPGFQQPFEFWSDPVTITVNANPAGDITYLHHDFAGSVIGATDANGAVIWKEDYQPYGERIRNEAAAAGNRQFYTGKPFDPETGLSYMGARYYDPAMGRFMGIDPVEFKEANLQSFNRYGYANNNPYRFVDPDGQEPKDWLPKGPNGEPAPIIVIGQAFGGLAAYVTGAITGNEHLAAVASQGLAETRQQNAEVLGILLGARGNGATPVQSTALTSNAARREAMRQAGIPTSQQPISQSRNDSGREYTYEVPAPGGGSRRMSVQDQSMDRSHAGQRHWEAGPVKTDPRTGASRETKHGRPALTNDKSKVDYE